MCFSISMDNGAILTVCTLNFNNAPVTENFFAAIINNHELFKAEKTVAVVEFKKYLKKTLTEEEYPEILRILEEDKHLEKTIKIE